MGFNSGFKGLSSSLVSPHKIRDTFIVLCTSVQINHQPDATVFQLIILTFIYSSTCFGRSPAHHQELMTSVAASGFTYFHKRYFIVNLQLKRDRRYYFTNVTVTIQL